MKVQLLVSTMHQNDKSLLDNLNLQSDAIIVNQCDHEGRTIIEYNGYNILWIDSKERGLSKSRNLALNNASSEICVICDDDEKLSDGYIEMINKAYSTLCDADIIAFNINRIGWNEKEKLFKKPKKVSKFKTYGSVHLTFKRESIINKNIIFNHKFGAGSGMYSSAEDAIFCMDCHRNGLKMFTHPGVICNVTCEESTWFTGYDEKYFYDVGAYLSVVFPRTKWLMKWYYPIRMRMISSLSARQIIRNINDGFDGYKKNMNYNQFKEKF